MLDKVKTLLDRFSPAISTLSGQDSPRSAVVVPLYETKGRLGTILIKRSDRVGLHRGQMGFPGGMSEPADGGDLLRTALREAFEEIGVYPEDFLILGKLSDRHTITSGLSVTPFVGSLDLPYSFSPDSLEVSSLHLARLDDLFTSAGEARERFDLPDPLFIVDGEPVWGLTAKILTELRQALAPLLKAGG